MWSLETSKCQGETQLARFDIPSLVVQSMGDMGVFPTDAHGILDAIASPTSASPSCPARIISRTPRPIARAAVDLMGAWIAEQV